MQKLQFQLERTQLVQAVLLTPLLHTSLHKIGKEKFNSQNCHKDDDRS
jgi:hypothetical protein